MLVNTPYVTPNVPGRVRLVHVTDRHTFKDCRRRYKYECVERLIAKKEVADALYIGSGSHYALAEYYRIKRDKGYFITLEELVALWEEWVAAQGVQPSEEQRTLCHMLMKNYHAFSAIHDVNWKILMVEQGLRVRIPGTNIDLYGTIDLLIMWRGQYWIVDHKNLAALPDAKSLEMDDQMTAYIWLLRQQGIKVRGCIYNVLRKKIPTVPRYLVRGELSRDKSIDTTYDVYMAEIEKHGLDPADYDDILDWLKKKPNTFNVRHPIARNQQELVMFEKNLVAEARDMTSKNTVYYPRPSWECGWCPFQMVCKAENEGSDTQLLKETLYEVKNSSHR